jgi:hypothetical protein
LAAEITSLPVLIVLVDFALFILIWVVQRIIYPSFMYHSPVSLSQWHTVYSKRIALIVVPLMLGQLLSAVSALFLLADFWAGLRLSLILLIWGITFFVFVPLHSRLNKEPQLAGELVRKNWWRTLLWSVIVIGDLSLL